MLDETPDRLGELTEATAAAVADLRSSDAVTRLWSADHTLWRPEPAEIGDRLGWLTVVPEMLAELDALRSQCDSLASGIDHVLIMGMGGSSLFPEVVARSYSPVEGRPHLHVLDTTDPDAIARVGSELPAERTLHIAASKSGTTLETVCQLEWAWERHPDPARFAVITDPASDLARLAGERGFAATWLNRPDIGGRYSALSHFGLVPALLAGVDVDGMLASASRAAERLRGAPAANPGAKLAAVMAAGVRSGRDKLTLVLPDEMATFGLWLEQLLAESTGKDGTGIVPVVDEPFDNVDAYGDDRLFVVLASGEELDHAGRLGQLSEQLDHLATAGHPVYVVPCEGLTDLGGLVLLWEVATALCGALLGIQPFDQPDVAAAKEMTNRVLAGDGGDADGTSTSGSSPSLEELLASVEPGDYLAIQAYVDPGSDAVDQIEEARLALRDRLRVATTVGLGPRYLHSTGQLHKGGPETGVFVQVAPGSDSGGGNSSSSTAKVSIPGRSYGFEALIAAQADGDLAALRQRGRRVARVDLGELLSHARR